MSNGLKQCPFCGSDVWPVEHIDLSIIKHFWRVECLDSDCEAEGISCTSYDSAEDAARIWNTRPVEDALRTENEELRAKWQSVPWEELYAATVLGLVWAAQATDDAAGGMDACNRALEWLAANAPKETTDD